jgi:hypothetical protein
MSHGMAAPRQGDFGEDQVRLQLKGLQHEVERTATVARWLGRLAILLVALLIAMAILIYLYNVMQYASVASVGAAAVNGRPGVADIEYQPASSGKIEFVRESDGVVEVLTEYAGDSTADKPKGKFGWSGREGEKSSLRVTYRSGLFLVTKDLPLAQAGSKE